MSHVGLTRYERVLMRSDAIQAKQSGFVKDARILLDTCRARRITLEQLLVRAFQPSKTLA